MPAYPVVLRQPLEHGIGEDQIQWFGGLPSRGVALQPHAAGEALPGFAPHLWRAVYPDQLRLRPAPPQDVRAVSGAAPHIGDPARPVEPDSMHEITDRLGALPRKFQILIGIPLGHSDSSLNCSPVGAPA